MYKILLVEDDLTTRQMLKMVLEKVGHTVFELDDGRKVFELIGDEAVDVIITDIFMPHQDGIEIISSIRKLLQDLPIIAISGGDSIAHDTTMLDIAGEMGADAIMKKPIELNELLRKIVEVI